MNLDYSSLNEQLRKRFPDLERSQHIQLIGGFKDGPYVVFGILFNRYLVDLAISDDQQARAGVASFIEDMAASHDERVLDLLKLELLPTILRSQAVVDAYWPVLGVATRRALSRLPPRFARNVELPPSD